jgi:Na+-transporting methylmalonyl-CoA/oxaloacetate decarboxylase gamma subunit
MKSELGRAFLISFFITTLFLATLWGGMITLQEALHLIGILGASLILISQLYTIRKRTRFLRSWKIKNVLIHHSILGIGGPILVIIHTNLEFEGIAGISAILMIMVFFSGFVGRFIYRRVPTTEKKNELERTKKELEKKRAKGVNEGLGVDEILENLEKQIGETMSLEEMIENLEKQLKYYRKMKKLLSNWRSIHWPLTITFFTTVILHIFVVYYYGGGT